MPLFHRHEDAEVQPEPIQEEKPNRTNSIWSRRSNSVSPTETSSVAPSTTSGRRGFLHRGGQNHDPAILAAQERVITAEKAEKDADEALKSAEKAVRDAREHVRYAREQFKALERELAEQYVSYFFILLSVAISVILITIYRAKELKVKQTQAKSISKRVKPLGRKSAKSSTSLFFI